MYKGFDPFAPNAPIVPAPTQAELDAKYGEMTANGICWLCLQKSDAPLLPSAMCKSCDAEVQGTVPALGNHEPVIRNFRITMTLTTGEVVVRDAKEFDFEEKWMNEAVVGYKYCMLIGHTGAYGYRERFECTDIKKEVIRKGIGGEVNETLSKIQTLTSQIMDIAHLDREGFESLERGLMYFAMKEKGIAHLFFTDDEYTTLDEFANTVQDWIELTLQG